MKKICVVTGSRAEFGLLRWVILGIVQSPELDLQLVVTGTHLAPEYGMTVNEVESSGFTIDRKVEMLLSSDTEVGVTKSLGLGVIGFGDSLAELKPDLMLVLGDRYEIFAAVVAAMVAGIPIAHLHGGETTEGAFDEAIRHSITKMSHLHFVAAEEYRKRVIQLGERPDTVFNVGGLGVDSITRVKTLARTDLEKALNFNLKPKNLLITFHPVTLEHGSSARQIDELLNALDEFREFGLIFTMPNADTGGRHLFSKIRCFCDRRINARVYTSLGALLYLSCVKYVDGVVGNSSSGLIEVPCFKKGTVNIGDRQRGRLNATSVINCEPNKGAIVEAIKRLLSVEFQAQLPKTISRYGQGGASEEIVKKLESLDFSGLVKKEFYNLKD